MIGRSRCSKRLSRQRRQEWLQWRSQRFELLPQDRLWMISNVCKSLQLGDSGFGRAYRSARTKEGGARQRDILPVGFVTDDSLKPAHVSWQRWILLRSFINTVILGLNYLYGSSGGEWTLPCRPTAAQKDVIDRAISSCLDFVARIESPDN